MTYTMMNTVLRKHGPSFTSKISYTRKTQRVIGIKLVLIVEMLLYRIYWILVLFATNFCFQSLDVQVPINSSLLYCIQISHRRMPRYSLSCLAMPTRGAGIIRFPSGSSMTHAWHVTSCTTCRRTAQFLARSEKYTDHVTHKC